MKNQAFPINAAAQAEHVARLRQQEIAINMNIAQLRQQETAIKTWYINELFRIVGETHIPPALLENLKTLLTLDIDINVKAQRIEETRIEETLLHKAAKNGHTEVVTLLLDRGADINAINCDGSTPLHKAASNGHTEVVRLLLDKGADINAPSRDGSTPLHYAASDGHTEVVTLLLDRGADINAIAEEGADAVEGDTPLHKAAKNGHTEVVTLLLDRGADINAINCDGSTPLHYAASDGHTEVVTLLLDRGADINAITEEGADAVEGYTPLHYAALSGETEVVRLLLNRGANIDGPNQRGNTPLHEAIWNDCTEVVTLLLDRGANIKAINHEGHTPLHYAAGNICTEAVTLLLDRGADIEAINKSNHTPLHKAIMNPSFQISNSGMRDYFLDEHNSHANTINYLLSKGALLPSTPEALSALFSSDRINTTPEFRHAIITLLNSAQTIQKFFLPCKGNIHSFEDFISDDRVIKLFSLKPVIAALKGMIYAHGLPRITAHNFIKKVKGADTSSEALNQLEKDLSFDTDGLLDAVKLLALSDLFKDKEFSCADETLRKFQDFADKASYYESLEASHQGSETRGEALHKAYPHPLDTEIAQGYFQTTTVESQIAQIAKALATHAKSSAEEATHNHLVAQMNLALEKNIVSAEVASFFQKILAAYPQAEKEAAMQMITTVSVEAASIGDTKEDQGTKRPLAHEEEEDPAAKQPTFEAPKEEGPALSVYENAAQEALETQAPMGEESLW
jgi:ankyrin repeat protein